jgi:hypothetical protein
MLLFFLIRASTFSIKWELRRKSSHFSPLLLSEFRVILTHGIRTLALKEMRVPSQQPVPQHNRSDDRCYPLEHLQARWLQTGTSWTQMTWPISIRLFIWQKLNDYFNDTQGFSINLCVPIQLARGITKDGRSVLSFKQTLTEEQAIPFRKEHKTKRNAIQ